MAKKPDITLNLPAEHFDALREVFAKGLKHAKIDAETKRELSSWWDAEREFIQEEFDKNE